MIVLFLKYISSFFIILGNLFLISSMIGLIRNKDFYVKLHAMSMFNVYGINFILFAMGILSYKPVIFFETIFVIIINTLITLTLVNCLFRNAILSGVPYKAKTRDDIVEEQTRKMEEDEKINNIKSKEDIKSKTRKNEDYGNSKTNDIKENKTIESKEDNKQDNKQDNKTRKIKENVKDEKNIKTTTKQPEKQNITNKKEKPVVDNTKTKDTEKENKDLKDKIKEQKKILRKKIETVRRNAFITRKPEEIEKAENTINEILTKYNLTEDMLKDEE